MHKNELYELCVTSYVSEHFLLKYLVCHKDWRWRLPYLTLAKNNFLSCRSHLLYFNITSQLSFVHNLKSCISVILFLIIFLWNFTLRKKNIGIFLLSVSFSLYLSQWLMSASSSCKLSCWISLKPCLQFRAIFSVF